MQKPSSEFIETLLSSTGVIITPHLGSDGDAVGSSLALSLILKARGIYSVILTTDKASFDREKEKLCSVFKILLPSPKYKQPKNVFPSIVGSLDDNTITALGSSPIHAYVDCSSKERIGEAYEIIYSSKFIGPIRTTAVDHHQGERDFASSYIVSSSPSTGNLMTLIAKEVLGEVCDKHLAISLFYAIASDTDSFRHLTEKDSDTFELASELVEKGANPSIIYSEMHSGKTLFSIKYLAKILSNVQTYNSGKVLVALDDKESFEEYGKFFRPSNSVYDALLSVEGAELVVFLKYKEGENETEGSLRVPPISPYNAHHLAEIIAGGGGHEKAAGFTFKGSIEEALKKVIEVI